jgi:hypothetical protein
MVLHHLHTSLFSPATQTWTKAIANNHLTSWPTFAVQEVHKHLPKSTTTGPSQSAEKKLKVNKEKAKINTHGR